MLFLKICLTLSFSFPRPAKTSSFIILLCLMPDDFPLSNTRRFYTSTQGVLPSGKGLTLSHPEALHWQIKSSGIRQSKVTKGTVLAGLGEERLNKDIHSWSSRKRPPWGIEKVVVARAGRLQELINKEKV